MRAADLAVGILAMLAFLGLWAVATTGRRLP